MTKRLFLPLVVLVLISCTTTPHKVSMTTEDAEWPHYARDKAGTKYSPLNQINRDNVENLQIAWRWQFPADQAIEQHPDFLTFIYEATPLMINGVLYANTSFNQIAAIDPTNGQTIWTYDPQAYEARSHSRGLAYWSDGIEKRLYINTADGFLISVDATNGRPDSAFGQGGKVNLVEGLRRNQIAQEFGVTSPPVVVGDVLVVGSTVSDPRPHNKKPPGDVRGFDVRTGEELWVFHSIPEVGEFGVETWEEESWKHNGNANVWTLMSADEELGYVYLPFSTPTNDWYGGHRPGDNLFAESLVCLNAKTGERVWHFQIIHHGLWDWDLPAAPNLMDIEVDGRSIKAVAQVTKHGFTFVFDRVTGEPVWPIEERPVPQSTVPGEKTSPTQPFPTHPPPFDRQGITVDDLIDFTPELHQEGRAILEEFHYGPIFMPPTVDPFVILPSAGGGANWNGAAFDPETKMLYIPSKTTPSASSLVAPDPKVSDFRYQGKGVRIQGPRGLPLFKPPYGRITAINLNTGEIEWMSPLGKGPRDHPALQELNLPRLGWPLHGTLVATKTLLFAGQRGKFFPYLGALSSGRELTADEKDEVSRFEPTLDVFDKRTGELIWAMALPANVTGSPISYMADEKQYIVFAIGGAAIPEEIIAVSLP
ncbi:MAG: pyrroloquinoline quinone-dependent dehydrogenase [Acidobacteriota bacterium]|nr:pyrroloquinoline quinone-dependent dehydrogenase [Acidobacteriota bacterium]